MPHITPTSLTTKTGRIVRYFWNEVVKRTDERYTTHYNIYFSSGTSNKQSSLTDGDAPKDLEVAKQFVNSVIQDPASEWTYAHVWEVRCMYRAGVEFDHKATEARNAAIRTSEPENA